MSSFVKKMFVLKITQSFRETGFFIIKQQSKPSLSFIIVILKTK